MAAFETTRVQNAPAGLFGQFFANLYASFKSWNDTRKTRAALATLTDAELEDIGLARADIRRIGA